MNIELIKTLIDQNKSTREITLELNTTTSKLRTFMKNNNLKTHSKCGIKTENYTHCVCCGNATNKGAMYCSKKCGVKQHILNNPEKYLNKDDNSKYLKENQLPMEK